MKLANKFLILGLILYILAGIAVISELNYSIFVLLVAVIFMAFGFFGHIRLRWIRLFKKRI